MPPVRAQDPAVAEYAGQLFFRLWRASHTRVAAKLAPLGLTTDLFALLNALTTHEGEIQQEIGAAMGIDPSSMVSLVDQLEKDGLAQRRPRPTDRRVREVVFTPKGRRVLKRAREAAQQAENEILGGLSHAERRRLMALLRHALETAPPQPLWSATEDDADAL